MAEIFTNLASTRLAASITSADTSLTVLTGDGDDLFPDPTGGDYFRLVCLNLTTGDVEIMAVTARTGDVCTVTRAYEGIGNQAAVAFSFNAGDLVELRPTAAFFTSLDAPTTTSIQQMDYNYAVDTGATDQYAVALSPAAASYASPMLILFLADHTNSGASTINVNTLGVKDIKRLDGTDPVLGDIVANQVSIVIYDDGDANFKLLNQRVPFDPSSFAQLAVKNVFTKTNVFSQASLTDADITAGVLTFPNTGNHFDLNSTEAITSIATVGPGATIGVRFINAQTLTHDGDNLVVVGGASIVTASGDEAVFFEYQIGKWRVISYTRASGGTISTALPNGTTATTQSVSDDSTKLATTAYVRDYIQKYTSSDLTFSTASASLAHSLSGEPQFVSAIVVCQSTDGGYSAGDKLHLNLAVNDEDEGSGAPTHGLSLSSSATHVTWRLSSTTLITAIHKTAGYSFSLDPAKWKLRLTALYVG